MHALEVALAGVTTDLRKTQASWPRLPEPNARRQPQLQVEGANQTWNWVIGSLGQWVIWVIFYVRVTGSPGHRVIILTRCETRVFPFFEKMPKMQNVHLKCWNDKSLSGVCCWTEITGYQSMQWTFTFTYDYYSNSLAWEYFFTHKSTFGVHNRTGSSGQLGLRVAGFSGHWVAESQNVTQFHVRCEYCSHLWVSVDPTASRAEFCVST